MLTLCLVYEYPLVNRLEFLVPFRRTRRLPEHQLRLQLPLEWNLPFRLYTGIDHRIVVLKITPQSFRLEGRPNYRYFSDD